MSATKTPAGQPQAYPRTRVTFAGIDKLKRPLPKFVYPHDVINIKNVKGLEHALEQYSHPFPMMDGSTMPKNPAAYRYYVEWIRPALRWFCKVYGHKIPDWLEGNGSVDKFTPADFKRFIGGEPLKTAEWHENTKAGRV